MLSKQINSKVINGQEMFFPSHSQWMMLKEELEIDDLKIPVSLVDFYFERKYYYQKYSNELILGLVKIDRFWLPIELLLIDNKTQRVVLEFLTCETCNWEGMVANPLVSELYLGLSDDVRQELLKKAMGYKVVSCPKCNSSLPRQRHPIWVEKNVG